MENTKSARSQSPMQDSALKEQQKQFNHFKMAKSATSSQLFAVQKIATQTKYPRINHLSKNHMVGSVRKSPIMFVSNTEKNEDKAIYCMKNSNLALQSLKQSYNTNELNINRNYLEQKLNNEVKFLNPIQQIDTTSFEINKFQVMNDGALQMMQPPLIQFNYNFDAANTLAPYQRRQSFMQNTMSNLQQYSSVVSKKHSNMVNYIRTSIGANYSSNEVIHEEADFSIKYVLNFSADNSFSIDIVDNHIDKQFQTSGGKGPDDRDPDEGLQQIKAFLQKYPSTIRDYIKQIDDIKGQTIAPPAPVKIPVSIPKIDRELSKQVRNLRFEFSDGTYTLKWDEPDGETLMERQLEIIKQGRKPFVGGNWKSNGDSMFVDLFTNSVLNKINFQNNKMEVMVAPSMVHIPIFNEYSTSAIQTGAQNVSKYDSGAFTSQVTGKMLKDMDCNWCIIGHSERRHIMRETDQDIGQKTKKAIDNGMNVIVCIGETTLEKETHQTKKVNSRQLQAIADEIDAAQWKDIVIAYEPVWAIGSGKTPSPGEVSDIHADIRFWLTQNISNEVAAATRIIYGGSVSAENCAPFIDKEEIDGFLVGGASMKPEFSDIVETVNKTIPNDDEIAASQTL